VGVALLDSSAVIAYLSGDDALHRDAVPAIERAVVDGATLAISAVTWSELLHGAHRGHGDEETFRGFVTEFGVAILAVDVHVAERSAALQSAYASTGSRRPAPKLRTPDALILATANRYDDIDTVICGDAKWPSVRGVNAEINLMQER